MNPTMLAHEQCIWSWNPQPHKSCSKKQRTTASPDSSDSMSQTIQDWRHNEKETRDPLHAPISWLNFD